MSGSPHSTNPDNKPGLIDNRRRRDDRAYEAITELEVRQMADELLRESIETMGRGEYPFYSPSWLRQLAARDAELPSEDDAHASESEYIVLACMRLLAQTPMKRESCSAIRLSIKGMEIEEIAVRLRTSPEQAGDWLKAGLARLAAKAVGLDEMLNEREALQAAWYEDTHRYACHDERHCKLGQEACRETCLCTRRWWLMYED